MTSELNNRKLCHKIAGEILETGKITGMSEMQLACEIFAHAYVFCNFRFVPRLIRKTSFAGSIYNSVANGVDLEDNGDTLLRRIFYRIVWIMPSIA